MKNRSRFMRAKKQEGRLSFFAVVPYGEAVIAAFITLFIGVALFSHNPHDPSWFYYSSEQLPVLNCAGKLGAQFAAFCFYMWAQAAYCFVGMGMYVTYGLWRGWTWQEEGERAVALSTLLITWPAILAAHSTGGTAYLMPGGYVGQRVSAFLSATFPAPGALLLLYTLLLVQVLLISRLSCIEGVVLVKNALVTGIKQCRWWSRPFVYGIRFVSKGVSVAVKELWHVGSVLKERMFQPAQQEEQNVFRVSAAVEEPEKHLSNQKKVPEEMQLLVTGESIPVAAHAARKKKAAYTVPPTTLFAHPKKEDTSVRDESKQVAAVLEEKLSRFGVVGSVTAIKKGPVVTLFEYQPAIDTKISKIIALEQDLTLALEAMSVRIVAPIPGTSRVGFEVSNKERKGVLFGDALRSQAYQQSTALLPLVLGQDTAGNQVVVDLADMPHVLVAGSTGSGKSVALNGMLISLLCRLTPQELKLIIIDPKRLEFAAYHDIAHLLFPIITDSHKAAPVIKWLVRLMEERYQFMAEQGVRSIHEYKKHCKDEQTADELPFIVLMIDELADLMMTAGRECEESIARLAQMARAAGIHLIVATQRPSVDVVTGVIKVNFPSRISFRLTSKIDSRTILDAAGAESLLGKGDMLFMDAQSARMRRVHGAYVSDAEIKKVADAIRVQQRAEYKDVQEIVAQYQSQQQELHDALLPEVLKFLATVDQVSISLLQRRFTVGYNRAARLMEILEMQGKVLPADGSKTRKVIH